MGLATIAVAALGALSGIPGFRVGGEVALSAVAILNVMHWSLGLLLLMLGLSDQIDLRGILVAVGAGLLAVAVAGALAPESLGRFLGFGGSLPAAYNLIHAALAIGAVVGAFLRRREVV